MTKCRQDFYIQLDSDERKYTGSVQKPDIKFQEQMPATSALIIFLQNKNDVFLLKLAI